VFPGPGPGDEPGEAWRFAAQAAIRSQPAVVDGIVYVSTDAGVLFALDVATGTERWSHDAGDGMASSPAAADGLVVAVTIGGRVFAVEADSGDEAWHRDEDAAPESMPAIHDGTVYVGTDNGTVAAMDLATGEDLWTYDAGAPVTRSPAIGNGVLYVGAENGTFHAVDTTSGEPRWTYDSPGTLIGTPSVGSGLVYVVHLDQPRSQVVALNVADGEEAWRFVPEDARGGLRPVTVGPETLYVAEGGGGIYALDPASGAVRWSMHQDDEIAAAPALVDDRLYVVSHGRIFAVDVTTSEETWSFDIEASAEYGPVVTDGLVIAGTSDGIVYALGAADGTARASASAAAETDGDPVAELDREIDVPDGADFVVGHDVDAEGRLYLPDLLNGQVLIFGADGAVEGAFGEPGSEPGQLDFTRDDNDPFNSIGEVFVGPDGTLWVANPDNFRVDQFGADGEYIRSIGAFGSGDGQFLDPIGSVVTDEGTIFVVDDERDVIQRFAPDGSFETAFGGHGSDPGQLNFTGQMALDADGNIWVADFGNHRVQAFDPDGDLVANFGTLGAGPGQLNKPTDLAVDADGRIFVTDSENLRIQVFEPDGTVVGEIRLPGLGVAAAASSLAIAGDELYITRFTNPDLLVYRILPPEE
jgi:outer membrane protein assembly factor BamB